MSKEKEFNKKEDREQRAIKYFCSSKDEVSNLETNDKYSRYDNTFLSADTKYAIEIKVRPEYEYEKIMKWGGAFLEFDKIEGIRRQQKKEGTNYPVLYFMFFKDCYVIYKLKNVTEYKFEMCFLNENDYSKNKVYKFATKLTENDMIEKKFYKE